jgi:hypothetical protein
MNLDAVLQHEPHRTIGFCGLFHRPQIRTKVFWLCGSFNSKAVRLVRMAQRSHVWKRQPLASR